MKLYKTTHGTISFIDIYESFNGYYLDIHTNDNTIRYKCYCDNSIDIGYSVYHDVAELRRFLVSPYISYRI